MSHHVHHVPEWIDDMQECVNFAREDVEDLSHGRDVEEDVDWCFEDLS